MQNHWRDLEPMGDMRAWSATTNERVRVIAASRYTGVTLTDHPMGEESPGINAETDAEIDKLIASVEPLTAAVIRQAQAHVEIMRAPRRTVLVIDAAFIAGGAL